MSRIKNIILVFILFSLILLIVVMSVRVDNRDKVENKVEDLNKIVVNREVEQLDAIFIAETVFIYQDESYNYSDLEKEIKELLEDNEAQLIGEGFYIDNIYEMDNLEADISLVADIKTNDIINSVSLDVKIERVGIFGWRISNVSSNDPDFGYLFTNYLIK